VPSRTRPVRAAIAPSATQGSNTGTGYSLENRMWSQRKNPSQPARSASTPSSISVCTSPMFGTLIP
jgi:hypothetical protein